MKFFYALIAFLMTLGSWLGVPPAQAVYTSHLQSDRAYLEAGRTCKGVYLILAKNKQGQIQSTGSGVLVLEPFTKKIVLLTAAHVLKGADTYEVMIEGVPYKVQPRSYFSEYLLDTLPPKTILAAKDLRTRKRLFVLRLKEEPDRLKDVLMSYGVDMAIGTLDDVPQYASVRYVDLHLPEQESSFSCSVAGYGEAGAGSDFGKGVAFWRKGSGQKRLFHTTVKPRFSFTLIDGETTNPMGQVYTYSSFFTPGTERALSGHVAPGDSGGGVFDDSGALIGLVSGTVSAANILKSDKSETLSFWEKVVLGLGAMAGHQSDLSYLLWQQANVYGSEAIYAGLGSPLIRRWLEESLTQRDVEERSFQNKDIDV